MQPSGSGERATPVQSDDAFPAAVRPAVAVSLDVSVGTHSTARATPKYDTSQRQFVTVDERQTRPGRHRDG